MVPPFTLDDILKVANLSTEKDVELVKFAYKVCRQILQGQNNAKDRLQTLPGSAFFEGDRGPALIVAQLYSPSRVRRRGAPARSLRDQAKDLMKNLRQIRCGSSDSKFNSGPAADGFGAFQSDVRRIREKPYRQLSVPVLYQSDLSGSGPNRREDQVQLCSFVRFEPRGAIARHFHHLRKGPAMRRKYFEIQFVVSPLAGTESVAKTWRVAPECGFSNLPAHGILIHTTKEVETP